MPYPARYEKTRNSHAYVCGLCDRRGWYTVTRYDGTGKTTACKVHVASVVFELSRVSPIKPGAQVRVPGELAVGIIHDVRWTPGEEVPRALVVYPGGVVRRLDASQLALLEA